MHLECNLYIVFAIFAINEPRIISAASLVEKFAMNQQQSSKVRSLQHATILIITCCKVKVSKVCAIKHACILCIYILEFFLLVFHIFFTHFLPALFGYSLRSGGHRESDNRRIPSSCRIIAYTQHMAATKGKWMVGGRGGGMVVQRGVQGECSGCGSNDNINPRLVPSWLLFIMHTPYASQNIAHTPCGPMQI